MSYSLLRLLTLPLAVVFSLPLAAQDAEFRAAFRRLASPTAVEREIAVAEIADLKGDIAAAARIAFKDATDAERRGLLEAFELRKQGALLAHAAELYADARQEDRMVAALRGYVLALPESELTVDESALTPAGLAAWLRLKQDWLRLEISYQLIDALQKPGKFHGQFEHLRRRDTHALDTELVCLIELEPGYAEALNEAAARRLAAGADADRVFTNPWRKLSLAQGTFDLALNVMRTNDVDLIGPAREGTLAGIEVLSDVRTAAVRALASSPAGERLAPLLRAWHRAVASTEVPAPMRGSVSLEGLRTELELTLARHGDRELLDVRLAGLRSTVERFAQGGIPVTARISSRPDIAARNEAAHLLLRSGDHAGAEKEWLALAREAQEIERLQRDQQRNAVATFLGSVYYNLACAQALQLKLTRAGQSLESAVAYGYRDYSWMLEDGDLECLRSTQPFRDWFSRLAPPALVDRLAGLDQP